MDGRSVRAGPCRHLATALPRPCRGRRRIRTGRPRSPPRGGPAAACRAGGPRRPRAARAPAPAHALAARRAGEQQLPVLDADAGDQRVRAHALVAAQRLLEVPRGLVAAAERGGQEAERRGTRSRRRPTPSPSPRCGRGTGAAARRAWRRARRPRAPPPPRRRCAIAPSHRPSRGIAAKPSAAPVVELRPRLVRPAGLDQDDGEQRAPARDRRVAVGVRPHGRPRPRRGRRGRAAARPAGS